MTANDKRKIKPEIVLKYTEFNSRMEKTRMRKDSLIKITNSQNCKRKEKLIMHLRMN